MDTQTTIMDGPVEAVHRFEAQALPVNAYLVETARGVVAIDGTLTVSDGRALRARVEALGKPLRAVLVTHAHPDHYGGIVELVAGDDVPILAVDGVDRIIRRDDAKEALLRPMFGNEWPRARTLFADDAVFYVGHGAPGGPELLDWQEDYICAFLDALRTADGEGEAATETVTKTMTDYLPAEELLFLMQLSVPPMQEKLAH